MGIDSGGGTSDWDAFADQDDERLEPEVVRWIEMYAEASDGGRDATVAAIFDEVNRLLRRYRRNSAVHRMDYGSRLRTLTEQLPIILWTTDAGLRVTTLAGGGLAAVDLDPSSMVSLSLAVVLGTDTPSFGMVDAHKRALRGQPAVFEYDRHSRSYLAHVQPLSDPDGAIVGTIGLAIDVTERKHAERALARREQQLADAQRVAHVGSWELDFATDRLTWSEEHYRIFGLRPELGPPSRETALAYVHPDDLGRVQAAWEATLRTGEPYACDYRIVRPDGVTRAVHGRGVLIRGVTGQPERAVGTLQDVTELRHAVEAVRASQQMLEHLLECFPNGSINVFDSDLRYVMAAGRGLVQVGLAPEQLIGKSLAELFPAELVAVVEAPYRRAFAGETATVDLPLAGRIYTLNAAPLDRVDGVVRTIIVVAQEVTERVQAEQERVEQRERQARLEGMLFTARHLTARVTSSLAASFSVIERLQPDPGLSPHVRDAVNAATTGLSEATRAIADLERLIHPATLEQPVRPAADDHPSNPKA